MNDSTKCPQCGKPVARKELMGLCPDCMLKAGLGSMADATVSVHHGSFVPPTVAELAGKFPQLDILELIGSGGMGAVYKARQKALDRFVALKILPPDVNRDPSFAERFVREAKVLAKLNHPNIVTLYEFGETEGLYYFLMEYVEGVNLRQLLGAGKIPPKEALAIVPPVCDALQFAHDRGIVHRDIKPENILLNRDGQVKIADFGVAKIIGSDAASDPSVRADPSEVSVEVTEAGSVIGTPRYMAPEQRDHPGEVDHRADIYSLGVVFYQMLTGELPAQKLEAPSKKVLIDVRLDEVVLRALDKNPERRYQHASDVKTMVQTIAATSALVSVPTADPSWHPPTSGWGWLIGKMFGITFTSRLAFKCANLSALGFLGSLGYLPFPGWQRCFGLFGFFGLIGVACFIELVDRGRNQGAQPASFSIVLVGRRGGKAVIRWIGVILCFLLVLAIAEVASIVTSLALKGSVDAGTMFFPFIFALTFVGLTVRRGVTTPVGQLRPFDKREAADPQKSFNPLEFVRKWKKTIWILRQTPRVRDVYAHLTQTEKRQFALLRFGAFAGFLVFSGFGGACFSSSDHVRWLLGIGVIFMGGPIMSSWQKTQRDFLCSSAWARQQGITPEQLKSPSFAQPPVAGPGASRVLNAGNCRMTTPERLATLAEQFTFYCNKGRLVLDDLQLTFSDFGRRIVIPLASIRELSVGRFPRVMNPAGLNYIVVVYAEAGQNKRVILSPYEGLFAFPSRFNQFVADWDAAIRGAITSATGHAPASMPADALGTPSSSIGIVVLFVGLLAIPAFLVFGGFVLLHQAGGVTKRVSPRASSPSSCVAPLKPPPAAVQGVRGRFPHGAHIGGDGGTVLLYHDDVDLHFALYYAKDFSSSDSSSHNTQSLVWQEKGSVKLKNDRTFGYLRESADEFHLSINGREFDLCQGRIIVLHDDGTAEQMKLFPSIATTKSPAELAKLIAATRTACETPVTFEKLLQQRDSGRE